jgi:hypothetical protein
MREGKEHGWHLYIAVEFDQGRGKGKILHGSDLLCRARTFVEDERTAEGSHASMTRERKEVRLPSGPHVPAPRLALVGDRYPPDPLEGKKALRGASGQLARKAIPSWAGLELLAEWANLRS